MQVKGKVKGLIGVLETNKTQGIMSRVSSYMFVEGTNIFPTTEIGSEVLYDGKLVGVLDLDDKSGKAGLFIPGKREDIVRLMYEERPSFPNSFDIINYE